MISKDMTTQVLDRSLAGRATSPSRASHKHLPRSRGTSWPVTDATSFSDLPGRIRHDIYKRVLVVAHPIYLFQDKGSRIETFAPEIPIRWLALLYSNRQIYDEARAVLYGLNRFVLVDMTPQQVDLLQSFLSCIRSVNANLLSHLCINFPVAEHMEDQPGEIQIREDSIQSLKLLRERCTNLTTLETFIHSKNSSFLIEADEDNSQFVRKALQQIDAQLKTVSSLKKIIIRVYVPNLTPSVIGLMEGFGWVVLFGER